MTQAISCERTLMLPEYCGHTSAMLWPVSWPPKDPGDVGIDFSLDVTGWLEQIQDTISTIVATWEPNSPADDFIITEIFSVDGVITLLASYGTSWVTYQVTIAATSSALGQVLSRTIMLPVETLYSSGPGYATSGQVSGVAV